ncbi:sensor domain-containing diguanylate cyclase [Anaerotignum sp. MB30-C6]|uniref:sensor domain-containing diguanylate cyclase n=1 Tax=Anaerotignum sp. MB30-C6 TaxID=3070814 RepID=UPI0027DC0F95|nr:diguanylate cyclase [Anaerotignum sp. MB30-C6]WMI82321.1 diguanylate cyclase [Anaerotignum sp. MB30-C6]
MREIKSFFWIFLIIIMFFGVTLFQVFEYSRHCKSLIEKQTYFTLQEHAESVGNHFRMSIEEQFNLLDALASYISEKESLYLGDLLDIEENNLLFRNFDEVEIANGSTGVVLRKDGGFVEVSDEGYFQNSMQGNRSIQYLQGEQGGSNKLLLSTPIYQGDNITSVLIVTVDVKLFENSICPDFFEGKSHLFFTTGQGEILDFGHPYNHLQGQNNFLSYLESINYNTSEIIENMNGRLVSSFTYSNGNEKYFTTSIPLEMNDWYIFCSAPEHTISKFVDDFKHLGETVIFTIFLTCCIFCLLISFLIKRSGALIKKEHKRFKLAEEIAGMVSFEGDYGKDTLSISDNYSILFGREPVIQKISDFAKKHPYIIQDDQDIFLKMGLDLIKGRDFGEVEYRVLCGDGSVQWHQLVYRVWHDKNGLPLKCYGMIVPIDRQMKEISKLQMQVEKDPLTGVLNRTAFEVYVNLCFNSKNESHALLLLDLDNFKQINDGYGHALGDHALVTTAEILKASVRNSDYVGRLGGDEFIIFLKNVSQEQAARKAGEICAALESAEMQSNEAVVTCSIGIACYPKDGCGFDELYELADKGLYKAKDTGKNSFSIVN